MLLTIITAHCGWSQWTDCCVCYCSRLRRSRQYSAARSACVVANDLDDPYNKSQLTTQLTSAINASCDYTVLPQDSLMTSSLSGGRRSVRSPNRAVYVSSLGCWRSEIDGVGRPDIEMDDSDRNTWPCDCQLLSLSSPPPPTPLNFPPGVSVSGLPPEIEDDPSCMSFTSDDHHRCTCTSGRCRQIACGQRLPTKMTSHNGPRVHVIDSSVPEDGCGETSDSQFRTRAPSSECNQY